MTIQTSQTSPPQSDSTKIVVPEEQESIVVPEEQESTVVPEEQEGTELYDSHTPDSYDPHIVPAETASRKDREGDNFKHLDKHPPGSESLNTTAGFTVDKEGLVDNFGVEPEMYYETPGDLQKTESSNPE